MNLASIQCVLMDIEGTITAIDFVHKTLFPYATAHLKTFVDSYQNDPVVAACLEDTQKTVLTETKQSLKTTEETTQTLLHWIEIDRKHPALKTLQGLIWEAGYQTGAYQGHLYEDVPPKLSEWQQQGLTLAIYSSGSVKAQQLLLQYSVFGDLRPYFSHYFDTQVGGKKEVTSYTQIAAKLNLPSHSILFLSDVAAELEAAQQAGMKVIQLCRPGNPVADHHFQQVIVAPINSEL